MTLKEKSKRKSNENPTVMPDLFTFNDIVDRACEGLMDCHIKYSIRRIKEMEANLFALEQELNAFLKSKNKNY